MFERIGLIAKRDDPGVGPTTTRVAAYLAERGVSVCFDKAAAALLGRDDPVPRTKMGSQIDACIVVGGDGTLLAAARAVTPFQTPIIGINRGRLGFMVDVLPDDFNTALADIFDGKGIRDERLMLQAELIINGQAQGPFLALNDIVVRNQAFARMVEFDTRVNGRFVTSHRADGIVIATPTGSTAYALSGGGPIIHPGVDAIALVPICPHTLSDRPLVIGSGDELEVVIGGTRETEALVTWDGQMRHALGGGDKVVIRAAEQKLVMIHPPGYDYYNILRTKLRWGRGQPIDT